MLASFAKHNYFEIDLHCWCVLRVWSFLLLCGIPLYGCTVMCLTTLLFIVDCFQFGIIMNKTAINIYIQFFV